jgi:hypothetical protein
MLLFQVLNKAQIKLLAQNAVETTHNHGDSIFNSCHPYKESEFWHVIVSGQCEAFEDEVSAGGQA